MKGRVKHFLSCLLIATLIFTSFDISAFAAPGDNDYQDAYENQYQEVETETVTVTETEAETETVTGVVDTNVEENKVDESEVGRAEVTLAEAGSLIKPESYSLDKADWSIRWKESDSESWNDHILTLDKSHIYDFKDEYRYYLFSGDHMITQEEYAQCPIELDNNDSYIATLVADDKEDPNNGIYITVNKESNYSPAVRMNISYKYYENADSSHTESFNTSWVYFVGALVRYSYPDHSYNSHTELTMDGNATFKEGIFRDNTITMYAPKSSVFNKFSITQDESDSLKMDSEIGKYSNTTYLRVLGPGETTFHMTYQLNEGDEKVTKDFKVTIEPTPVITEDIDPDYSLVYGKSVYRDAEGVESPSGDEMKKHEAGYPIIGVIGFENKHHESTYSVNYCIKDATIYIDGVKYATIDKKDWYYSSYSSTGNNYRFAFNLGYVPESVISAGVHSVTITMNISSKDRSEVYSYTVKGDTNFIKASAKDVDMLHFSSATCRTFMLDKGEKDWLFCNHTLGGLDEGDEIVKSELVWDDTKKVIKSNNDVGATYDIGLDPFYEIADNYISLFNIRLYAEYVGTSNTARVTGPYEITPDMITKDGYVNVVYTSKSGKKFGVDHVAYFIGDNTDKVIAKQINYVNGSSYRDNTNLGYLMPDICGNYLSIYVYKGKNYSEDTIPTFYMDAECTKPVSIFDENDDQCIVERDPDHPEYIYYTVKKDDANADFWSHGNSVYVLLKGMNKENVISSYYSINPIQGVMVMDNKLRVYISPTYAKEGNEYIFSTGYGTNKTENAVVYSDMSGLYAELSSDFYRSFRSYRNIDIKTATDYGYSKYYLPETMSYSIVGRLEVPKDIAKWELHKLTVMGTPLASGELNGAGSSNVLSQELIDKLAESGDIFRACYKDASGKVVDWQFVKFKSSKVVVTYYSNGGLLYTDADKTVTDTVVTKNYVEGDKYSFPEVFREGDYRFIGWYTDSVEGYRVDENSVIDDQNISLYARWAKIETVEAPEFSSPDGSALVSGSSVTIKSATPLAKIYYTTDGSEPTIDEKNLYSGDIVVDKDMTIKAIAVKEDFIDSAIVSATYTVIPDWGTLVDEDKTAFKTPDEIPAGLWIAGIVDADYTGKAITQSDYRVYDNKKLLIEKTDYTVKYTNNTNAGTANIIVTGKGNYTGTVSETFKIKALDITPEVSVLPISVAYNKNNQKVNPVVTYSGKKLVVNKDYKLVDELGNAVTVYKEVGTYNVIVKGIGNYTGTTSFKFIITDAVPASKVAIASIKAQKYDGKEIKPAVKITYKGKEVTDSFDVTFDNNIEIGTATVIATAKEGTDFVGVKTASFKITGTSISSAKAAPIPQKKYDGKAYEPKLSVTLGTVNLEEGKDYEITSYTNNVKVGTAKVTITGKGAYTGTKTFTYKIVANDTTSLVKIDDGNDIDVAYEKGGAKPRPKVTFDGVELTEKTDYTLSYVNANAVADKSAAKAPTLTVTLKGSYKGKIAVKYTIVQKNISEVKVTIADKVNNTKKANSWKQTALTLTDTNGSKLAANTDYIKSIKYYRDAACTEELTDTIVADGTTVYVKIDASNKNYKGSVVGSYRLSKTLISGTTAKIADQTYTGDEIRPIASQITVTKGKDTLKPGVDYIVVPGSYTKNTNKGTATLTIQGIGTYCGTKNVTYKIVVKKIVK